MIAKSPDLTCFGRHKSRENCISGFNPIRDPILGLSKTGSLEGSNLQSKLLCLFWFWNEQIPATPIPITFDFCHSGGKSKGFFLDKHVQKMFVIVSTIATWSKAIWQNTGLTFQADPILFINWNYSWIMATPRGGFFVSGGFSPTPGRGIGSYNGRRSSGLCTGPDGVRRWLRRSLRWAGKLGQRRGIRMCFKRVLVWEGMFILCHPVFINLCHISLFRTFTLPGQRGLTQK